MKKRIVFVIAFAGVLIMVFAAVAAAGEIIYISEPAYFDTPKMLPRADASLWNMDYRCNPALLKLDCPYGLIHDTYYLGSYDRKSTSDFGAGTGAPGAFLFSSVENKYVTDVVGGDLGFAMRLNDRSNLAFIFNYRYGNVLGDGNFVNAWSIGGPDTGRLDGSLEQKLESNTFAASVLWDMKFSDAFTLGAALKYTYTTETFRDEISGNGINIGNPENLDAERDLSLKYHYLSPKVGISFVPSNRFTLNASVAAGFYLGGRVDKDTNLFEDAQGGSFPGFLYTEDLGSSDISGWDIAAKVRPEFKVSDALSIPVVVDFWYKNFKWGVDGTSFGFFGPWAYGGIFQGPGTIDYANETTNWDITGGAGLKYDAGWATFSGMLSYTHRDFNDQYDQENMVTSAVLALNGLTSFSQDDTETRDIISLGLKLEKQFSEKFSADFGVCYDLGWGHRRYDLAYTSPYETVPLETLSVSTEGNDTYQNLTLSTHVTFVPAERLSLTLGAFVTMPLESLDYQLDGVATGLTDASIGGGFRFTGLNGDISRDYENTGWDFGGLLSLTYTFGCPVATPPPAPPAPVIEPKLEPMSFK